MDPFLTENSIERWRELPSFTSFITSYGKSIILPLVTPQQREEILRLKEATRIKAQNLERKGSKIYHSTSVTGQHQTNQVFELVKTSKTDNYEIDQYGSSALHSSNALAFNTSPPNTTKDLNNEMHMSICNIPSDGICSTVHKGLIVFPKIDKSYDDDDTSIEEINTTIYQNKSCRNVTPESCVFEQGSIVKSDESFITEQMCSVSEDEQDSITEETEFGSMGTVICAGRIEAQDTDNESSVTYVTQSTDLDMYMDYSIDYSSPEDARKSSSKLHVLSRTDDGSMETLVNTDNEETPCASAMAELGVISTNSQGKDIDVSYSNYLPQRAHSMDSYMKIVNKCVRKLFVSKANSEPPADTIQLGELGEGLIPNIPGVESTTTLLSEDDVKADLNSTQGSEVIRSKSSNDVIYQKDNEGSRKKHIRRNSYTLDHPSPALLTAHADCMSCSDIDCDLPHSCSLDKISVTSSITAAFRKEKVNIVLPPLSDRDKYFPIFGTSNFVANNLKETRNVSSFISIDGITQDGSNGNDEHILSSERDSETVEGINLEKNNTNEQMQQHITPNFKSSNELCDLNSNKIQDTFLQVVHTLKESQASRVRQFLDEQTKQWNQLQEELKQQEKLLCEMFNLVDISSFTEEPFLNKSPQIPDTSYNNNLPNSNTKNETKRDIFNSGDSAEITMPEYLSYKTNALSHSSLPYVSDAFSTGMSPGTRNDGNKSNLSLSSNVSYSEIYDDTPSPSTISLASQSNINTVTLKEHLKSIDQELFHKLPQNTLSSLSENVFIYGDNKFHFQLVVDVQNEDTLLRPMTPGAKNLLSNSDKSLHDGLNDQRLGCESDFLSGKDETDGTYQPKTSRSCNVLLDAAQNENFSNANHPELLPLFTNTDSHISQVYNVAGTGQVHPNSEVSNVNLANCYQSASNAEDQTNKFAACYSYDSDKCTQNYSNDMEYDHLEVQDSFSPFLASIPGTPEAIFQNGNCDILNIDSNIQQFTKFDILLCELQKEQNIFAKNTKEMFDNMDDQTNGYENSDSESVKALRDFVKTAPMSKSYYRRSNQSPSKPMSVPKSFRTVQKDSQKMKSISKTSLNPLSDSQTKAPKQIISESLTNLKRRQSKDMLKDPAILKKFEKLPAFVKGYLTRRLFQTERVQGLITTLQDTVMLVRELSDELTLKGDSVSEHDVELHKQLIVQLLTTFQNVYDIFCTMSTKEQMRIIAESRNFRKKKKNTLINNDQPVFPTVSGNVSTVSTKKSKLSSATLKALERRKRSIVDSRTYTVDDVKCCRPRVRSSSSSKCTASSSIYKSYAGISMKRKTANVRKTMPWK